MENNVDDTESGRVKGSIKDRIIAFLYRKRFKVKLEKNNLISRITSIQIKKDSIVRIENYRDLKKFGNKIIPVDIKNEKFDFKKYDYYIIEPIKKKGISDIDLNEINNKDRALNQNIEIINRVKKDVKSIIINKKYPKNHQENLDEKLVNVRENFQLLKDKINENINLSTYLDNIEIKIAKYDSDSLYEAEILLNKCEQELQNQKENLNIANKLSAVKFSKTIGNINIKKELSNDFLMNKGKEDFAELEITPIIKLNKVNKKALEKKNDMPKKTIKVLNKFNGAKFRQLKNNEEKIKTDVKSVSEIVYKMNKQVDKVTKEINTVTKVTGYSDVLKSCLKIATGLLTLPFTGMNLFNMALGSTLINRGLKGIKKGLEIKEEIRIDYRYEDLTNKIRETKDKAKLTELLIMDSLSEIKSIKKYEYLGEKNLNMLNKLEDNLNNKLKEIDKLNINLSKQNERNQIKIKKVEKKQD